MRHSLLIAPILLASASLIAESAAGMRWTAPASWKAEAAAPDARGDVLDRAGRRRSRHRRVCRELLRSRPGRRRRCQHRALERTGAGRRRQACRGQNRQAHRARRRRSPSIDASGTYTGMGGPMSAGPKPVPGYRLIGAIVEGPGGSVFFKLTGPAKTIAATAEEFRSAARVDSSLTSNAGSDEHDPAYTATIPADRRWPTSSSSSTFCSSLFVVLGGLLALRWPRVVWLHRAGGHLGRARSSSPAGSAR